MAAVNGFEGERRHIKTRIPAHVSQIGEARRFVEQVISEGALSDDRAFDLEVAVSEACASAIERSEQEVELAAWRLRDRVVVEISSRGEHGFNLAETDEPKLPLSLPLMTSLADQVQISRLSDHLTRVSLTFLVDPADDSPSESIEPSEETGGESERERLLEDPRVRGHVLTSAESQERKVAEARLMRQAFRDPLTGLANRALFFDRLASALSRADRRGSSVALVLIDLDDFKKVNDSWGHAGGDRLLVELAERLGSQLRAEDTAARLGGDEFALVLEEGTGAENAARTVERILARLRAPLTLAEASITPGVSAGLAVRPPRGCGAEELLQQADFALYAAKSDGKNNLRLYESGISAPSVARRELETDLQRALERGEIVAHYQPILSTRTGLIVGLEALCRWRHPRRGLLTPDHFLPMAEESGLIVPLGDLVLRQACETVQQWDALHPGSSLWMAVNLCGRQLREPRMVDALLTTLADSKLEPERLVLDINEDVLAVSDEKVLQTLVATKEAGIRLAIDDFGTGCSSLSLLGKHPAEFLKIAKTLVDSLDDSAGDSVVADAIMGLARCLSKQVVAEGVERREQLERLGQLGCDMWQGWYFSPALKCSQLLALSRDRAA